MEEEDEAKSTDKRTPWMGSERPFWFPDAKGFLLGSMIFICGFTVIYRMRNPNQVDDKILDMMITILFSTCLVLIYNWSFGSSSGKESQDRALTKIAMEPVAPVAPVAPVLPLAPVAPVPPEGKEKIITTVPEKLGTTPTTTTVTEKRL